MLFQGKRRLSVGIDLSELLTKTMCTSTGADANVRTKCGKGHTSQLAVPCTELSSFQVKANRMALLTHARSLRDGYVSF